MEIGIFPSYVGLESYLPQENWSYVHAFISDATPYYFFGFRGQLFATIFNALGIDHQKNYHLGSRPIPTTANV